MEKKPKRGRPQVHNYCDREELRLEIMEYQETKEFSPRLLKMFQSIIDGYGRKYQSKSEEVQQDKKGEAMLHLLKGVHNYDPDRNAFAYCTQIVKNAFRYYWKTFEQDREKQVDLSPIRQKKV